MHPGISTLHGKGIVFNPESEATREEKGGLTMQLTLTLIIEHETHIYEYCPPPHLLLPTLVGSDSTTSRRLQPAIKHPPYIIHYAQISKEWAQIRQLGIMRVIKPRRDGHSIIRVKDVRRRRVIQDDCFCYRAAELR